MSTDNSFTRQFDTDADQDDFFIQEEEDNEYGGGKQEYGGQDQEYGGQDQNFGKQTDDVDMEKDEQENG